MKKLILIAVVIVGLFGLLAGMNYMSTKSKSADAQRLYHRDASQLNPLTVKQLTDEKYQNIILPDELDKKLADQASFFVYYFKPDCPHCMKMTPILHPLTKELAVDMKQFNLMEFSNAEGWDKYHIDATPTLIFYKNGQPADKLVGEQPEDTYRKFFTTHKAEQ